MNDKKHKEMNLFNLRKWAQLSVPSSSCLPVFVWVLSLASLRERHQEGEVIEETLTKAESSSGFLSPQSAKNNK